MELDRDIRRREATYDVTADPATPLPPAAETEPPTGTPTEGRSNWADDCALAARAPAAISRMLAPSGAPMALSARKEPPRSLLTGRLPPRCAAVCAGDTAWCQYGDNQAEHDSIHTETTLIIRDPKSGISMVTKPNSIIWPEFSGVLWRVHV